MRRFVRGPDLIVVNAHEIRVARCVDCARAMRVTRRLAITAFALAATIGCDVGDGESTEVAGTAARPTSGEVVRAFGARPRETLTHEAPRRVDHARAAARQGLDESP